MTLINNYITGDRKMDDDATQKIIDIPDNDILKKIGTPGWPTHAEVEHACEMLRRESENPSTEFVPYREEPTQLDRIEAKLDQLLAKKKPKPRVKNDFIMMRPEFVSDKAWEAYIKHRKQKKVAITEQAYNIIFKKLEQWNKAGHDVDAILNQSVENGWTGLFEIKTNDKPQVAKKEHISQTYKQYDPNAPTEEGLDPVDPYADLK